jgi:plastocyanin
MIGTTKLKTVLASFFLLVGSITTQAADLHGQLINQSKYPVPKRMVVYLDTDKVIPPSQKKITFHQKNRQFSENFAVISKGTKVSFSNDEIDINHNIFSRSPAGSIDLGLFEPGMSPSYDFQQKGRVKLLCRIHRRMRMDVYVTPTPWFAQVKKGRYIIRDIPAGEYKLTTWTNNGRLVVETKKIVVKDKHISFNITLKNRPIR